MGFASDPLRGVTTGEGGVATFRLRRDFDDFPDLREAEEGVTGDEGVVRAEGFLSLEEDEPEEPGGDENALLRKGEGARRCWCWCCVVVGCCWC